jgi:SH3-like domain-containing protein
MTGRNMLPIAISAICLSFAMTSAQARKMVSVDRPEANLRAGAGTKHKVIWVLSRGYPLEVLGRSGNWLKVRDFERDVGWIYKPLTSSKPHQIVKSRVANIRSGPGTGNRILGQAEYGEVMRTLENKSKWAKVRNGKGLVGWIAKSLLWGW